jgi:hypothetical protein
VAVPRQSLLIEDQCRHRHDGHHHQGERQKRGTGSHGAEPAAIRALSAIFRPLSQA